MMIMFLKHSRSKDLLSESDQEEIAHRFLLVFSDLSDLDEINQKRIGDHYEETEKTKADKK